MASRKGERIGWSVGWLSGFIWVAALSILLFFQQKFFEGALGFIVLLFAVLTIIFSAPWKHPKTEYWKLFVFPYFAFFLSLFWAIWAYGGLKPLGLNWWNLLWILIFIIPYVTSGNRRWSDGEPEDTKNQTLK